MIGKAGVPSKTNWRTPPELFTLCNEIVGGFKVDAAADWSNFLTSPFYGDKSAESTDALSVDKWASPAWCNPPYGKGIQQWLKKFIEQRAKGVVIVALLPARIETRWWNDFVVPYANVLFLVGRVPFIDPARTKPSQPDHASAVCVYKPGSGGRTGYLNWKRGLETLKDLRNAEEVDLRDAQGETLGGGEVGRAHAELVWWRDQADGFGGDE